MDKITLYLLLVLITIILTTVSYWIYKLTRRYTSIDQFPRNVKGIKLTGIVTSICDGDGFRFFHTPMFRSIKHSATDTKLCVRLAGIDAPETRFYNVPAQPLSKESKEYLASLILNKKVSLEILGIDKYDRILAMVYTRSYCFKRNINLEMIRSGMACVYDGKDGLYGGLMDDMLYLEKKARDAKLGIWKLKNMITPMEYKKMKRGMKMAIKTDN